MSEHDSVPESPQQNVAATQHSPLRRLGLWFFGLITSRFLRALGATWRIETLGHDPQLPGTGGPAHLAALFHESMLPSAWLYRDSRYSVAVSRSRDGDLIRATLLALGYAEPARGSSSRGGSAALRQMVVRTDSLEMRSNQGASAQVSRHPNLRRKTKHMISCIRISGEKNT